MAKGCSSFFNNRTREAAMYKKSLFLMFLLSVSLNAVSGEVDVKKLHKGKWIEVASENFLVMTDAKEERAQAMARELEQFRHFLAMLLGYKQRELPQKIVIILAKDKSTFTALGMPKDYAGIFIQAATPLIFANSKGFSSSDDGKASMGRQVVLHELTHLLINNASISLANPPWYSEGTAEYFGSYSQKKDTVFLGEMGLLQNRFYSLVKWSSLGGKAFEDTELENIDTESLFKAANAGIKLDMNRGEEKDVGKFYARALAAVHYLNADPERRKQMYQYLYLINKGYTVDDAFKAVFKMTFAEFDTQLNKYISGEYVYARIFNGIKYPEFKFSTRPLEPKEAMRLVISRIAMAGPPLMEEGDINTMYRDIKKLYPDIFE
jgi:hypothetical protein